MDEFVALLASSGVYGGGMAIVIGLITLARPARWLRIGTRRKAAAGVIAGAALVGIGFLVPARQRHVETQRTELDRYFPVWQFAERHSIEIAAPPDRVYRAIKEVTADEIPLFQALTWIRRFGRSGPENILNAPATKPLMEVATRSGFRMFADEPDRETLLVTMLVVPPGRSRVPTPEEVRTLAMPGYAKVGMNFLIEPIDVLRTRVVTETRVFATDAPTVSVFKRYWRMIYPGSAIIRLTWLRAIKRRAEAASTSA